MKKVAFLIIGFVVIGLYLIAETKTIPLIIHTHKQNSCYEVEVAENALQRVIGLMFRKELSANNGMIFIYEESQKRTFWMKNVSFPLDMIFIRASGEISKLVRNARPNSELPISSDGPVIAVLELRGGTVDNMNIYAGDKVNLPNSEEFKLGACMEMNSPFFT